MVDLRKYVKASSSTAKNILSQLQNYQIGQVGDLLWGAPTYKTHGENLKHCLQYHNTNGH